MAEYSIKQPRKSAENVRIDIEKVEKESAESRKNRLMAYLEKQSKNGKE